MTVWSSVYWIGGSPCSGKSSIAEGLANDHDIRVYHCDDHFEKHVSAADPTQQPHLHRLQDFSWDALFMRPVAEQVADEIAVYQEEFELILDDLRQLLGETALIVEGSALLPDLVLPCLPARSHAIFVIPSAAFQRETYAQRSWRDMLLAQCRDPEKAWENWMARDEQFGEYTAAMARTASLPLLHVDGSQSLEENTRLIAKHFGLL